MVLIGAIVGATVGAIACIGGGAGLGNAYKNIDQ